MVWLFDESGSLRGERKAITKRFRRIYQELGVIEASKNPAFQQHRDKPLLTAVVGFGSEPRILTKTPTDQIEEIVAAVEGIDADAARIRRRADGKFDPKQYEYYSQENVFTRRGDGRGEVPRLRVCEERPPAGDDHRVHRRVGQRHGARR